MLHGSMEYSVRQRGYGLHLCCNFAFLAASLWATREVGNIHHLGHHLVNDMPVAEHRACDVGCPQFSAAFSLPSVAATALDMSSCGSKHQYLAQHALCRRGGGMGPSEEMMRRKCRPESSAGRGSILRRADIGAAHVSGDAGQGQCDVGNCVRSLVQAGGSAEIILFIASSGGGARCTPAVS